MPPACPSVLCEVVEEFIKIFKIFIFFSFFFLVWLSREGHQKRVVNGACPSFLVLCWRTPKFHFLKTRLSLSVLLTAPLGANVPD